MHTTHSALCTRTYYYNVRCAALQCTRFLILTSTMNNFMRFVYILNIFFSRIPDRSERAILCYFLELYFPFWIFTQNIEQCSIYRLRTGASNVILILCFFLFLGADSSFIFRSLVVNMEKFTPFTFSEISVKLLVNNSFVLFICSNSEQ